MKYRFHILLSALICLSACNESEWVDSDRRIRLSAIVEGRGDTRAPYTEQYPSQTNELHAAVWASTEQGVFPDDGYDGSQQIDGVYKVAKHTKANFQHPDDQLLIDAIYPLDAKDVYFVAMYPETLEDGQTLWTYSLWDNEGQPTPAATTVFDGSEDVMFAPQVTGVYGNNKNQPQLRFHHLLTWLRIKFVANSEEASQAWGAIKNMTIQTNNTVTIDLSHKSAKSDTNPDGYDREKHVYFSNPAVLGFYSVVDNRNTDNGFLAGGATYGLKGPKVGNESTWESFVEEVAYVMCAPVTASSENPAEYTLNIETENRGNIQVPVNLLSAGGTDFTGSTMGKQFTILLKFKIGENIAVSGQVSEWATGGISYGYIEE